MNREKQFENIYKENFQRVHGLCLGYVNGDPEMSNDLTQEVFIKIWENLDSFRNDSKVSTWIYRITVNTCLLFLRKKKSLPLKTEQIVEEEEDKQAKEVKFRKMYRCIDLLPDQSRTIILLELENLPQSEIAEIMGISHEAIRIRIHRIKKDLTKCVNK